jgi:hypothetical protein
MADAGLESPRGTLEFPKILFLQACWGRTVCLKVVWWLPAFFLRCLFGKHWGAHQFQPWLLPWWPQLLRGKLSFAPGHHCSPPGSTGGTRARLLNSVPLPQIGLGMWKRGLSFCFCFDSEETEVLDTTVHSLTHCCGQNCGSLPNKRYVRVQTSSNVTLCHLPSSNQVKVNSLGWALMFVCEGIWTQV